MALGSSGRPSSRKRQASKRFGPNPERRIDFRNCFGMIWSVSTLARSRGATASSLPSLEIAVRGRGAALPRLKAIGVHGQAHRAAGFAPLEAGVLEDPVEAFALGLRLH